MGCFYSDNSENSALNVPLNILPDPGLNEICELSIKKLGSKNVAFVCSKGIPYNEKQHWMLLVKTLTNEFCEIEVENFVRGSNNPEEGNKDKGQVLIRAMFYHKPDLQQRASNDSAGYLYGFYNDYEPFEDSYYQSIGNWRENCTKFVRVFWCINTSVTLIPVESRASSSNLELKIFANGSCFKTEHRIKQQGQTGHGPPVHTKVHEYYQYVDRIEYMLTNQEGIILDQWFLFGDTRTEDAEVLSCSSSSFSGQITGSWFFNDEIHVKSKEGFDPCVSLVLAHLCLFEYTPNKIKGFLDNIQYPR